MWRAHGRIQIQGRRLFYLSERRFMDNIGCLMVSAQGGVLCSPPGGTYRRVAIENPANGRYPLSDLRHSAVEE